MPGPDHVSPWDEVTGIARLKNLPENGPEGMQVPPGIQLGERDSLLVLRTMMIQLEEWYFEEQIWDLMELYTKNLENHGNPQAWQTLSPDEALRCWEPLLTDPDGPYPDPGVLGSWKNLVMGNDYGPFKDYGYMEGARVLHHLLKDSEDRSFGDRDCSGWLKKAVERSKWAITNWQQWPSHPPSGSSSSSSPWGTYTEQQRRGFR